MVRSRAFMQLPENPSILVLLVATDGERWLPDVLRGLRAQKYRPLKVVAVDNASTDASAELLRKAFGTTRVVTMERRVGYGRALAAALKVASERSLDADAFLLLHDDAVLGPEAIDAMVETLRSDGAGIVGAKLLEWDDARMIQSFGQTTDRYGRIVDRIDRGEIDQGQHDGVHDVLYASSAALLIARELVERVGLFDMRYLALRDDLDLCWRARIAGYSTLVTSDAVARHASATVRDLRDTEVRYRVRYVGDRNMIATLIKNYSVVHLLLALPMTLAISIVNVLLYVARGRRRSALQVLRALQWNVAHLPSTVRARRKAQAARKVSDREVTRLMHHGATRVRAQVERAIEKVVGEVEVGPEEEEDRAAAPPRVIDRLRAHPAGVILAVVAVVAIIGARPLLVTGQLAGAELAPFPDAGGFLSTYASGWRGATAGGAGPASPALVVLGLLTFVSLGSAWLAQRVLLFGLPIVAAITMWRLARAIGLGPAGKRLATVLYATSPLVMGAFGAGRLPDLVLTAAAPGLVLPLLRAAGVAQHAGKRLALAGVGGLAVTAAFVPWALPFIVAAGVTIAWVASGRGSAVKVLRRTGLMVGGALVLLFPWSIELFRSGSPMGGNPDIGATMTHLIALAPEVRHVPLALAFGIAAAGTLGATLAARARPASAAALGSIGVIGLGASWAVARGVPWIAPRPALPLVATALALTVFAGIALDAGGAGLTARTFGASQVIAGLIGVVVVAQLGATAAWVAFGDRTGLVASGDLLPSDIPGDVATAGAFRLLWVGGSADAPAVALSDPNGVDMRGYLARSGGAGTVALGRAVASIVGGTTEAGGRQLATLGVRYVLLRPDADEALHEAFARQLDLGFRQDFGQTFRTTVYVNEAALPVAATVGEELLQASDRDLLSLPAIDTAEGSATGMQRRTLSTYEGDTPDEGVAILLAEGFSPSWRLRIGDRSVRPEPSFGWATRFVVSAGEHARISWGGQGSHRALLAVQAVLVFGFLLVGSQRREKGR